MIADPFGTRETLTAADIALLDQLNERVDNERDLARAAHRLLTDT